MLQVERQPKVIGDSQGGPGPPVHLDRKLSLARNPLAIGLPARRRTERGSDSRLANRTAFCSVLIAHSSSIAARAALTTCSKLRTPLCDEVVTAASSRSRLNSQFRSASISSWVGVGALAWLAHDPQRIETPVLMATPHASLEAGDWRASAIAARIWRSHSK